MTVEQMRAALCQRYPGGAFAQKVPHMTDEQVMAIHYRLNLAGAIKPVKKVEPSVPTKYRCFCCGAEFYRDEPDLTECQVCGSKDILRQSRVKVRKGNNEQDN